MSEEEEEEEGGDDCVDDIKNGDADADDGGEPDTFKAFVRST